MLRPALGFRCGFRRGVGWLVACAIVALAFAPNISASWEKGDAALAAGDPEKASRFYRRAAKQGVPSAMYSLAVLYLRGEGVEADDEKAIRWLEKAAKAGLPAAQTLLANLYSAGRGVPRDDEAAAEWYRKAANLGDPKGQVALAIMLHTGRGVEVDDVEAAMWLALAEKSEYEGAGEKLAVLEDLLGETQRSEAHARAEQWKPTTPKRSQQPDAPQLGAGGMY